MAVKSFDMQNCAMKVSLDVIGNSVFAPTKIATLSDRYRLDIDPMQNCQIDI